MLSARPECKSCDVNTDLLRIQKSVYIEVDAQYILMADESIDLNIPIQNERMMKYIERL